MQDFVNFMKSMASRSDWVPVMGTVVRNRITEVVPGVRQDSTPDLPEFSHTVQPATAASVPSSPIPRSRASPEISRNLSDHPVFSPTNDSLVVSERMMRQLSESLYRVRSDRSNVQLPSRYALSRFVRCAIDYISKHIPCMHVATTRLEDCVPELILALSALGAEYSFEFQQAKDLFLASTNLVDFQSHWQQEYSGQSDVPASSLQSMQTLLILLRLAIVERDRSILSQILQLQHKLVLALRTLMDDNCDCTNVGDATAWHRWIEKESIKRMRLMAFCSLSLLNLTHNISNAFQWCEIAMPIACSRDLWEAPDALSWHSLLRSGMEQCIEPSSSSSFLQEVLDQGLDTFEFSALQNNIFLHAILQRVDLLKQLYGPFNSTQQWPSRLTKIHTALYQISYKYSTRSRLDYGTMNLTKETLNLNSFAILGIGLIRTASVMDFNALLQSRSPLHVTLALKRAPLPTRSSRATSAAFHATMVLEKLAFIGLNRFPRKQDIIWDFEFWICAFECAIFHARWLMRLSNTAPNQSQSQEETKVLCETRAVVAEGLASLELKEDSLTSQETPLELSLVLLRVWASILSNNAQLPLVQMLGESLLSYLHEFQTSVNT
ncbi:hypothetical protein BS50DRAFT_143423 [Corynespora cassiicola Philippines]|uniref:Transcription factor domain-containing protein n=1 Tax=Corynespora cassiicola Philippines TaxID=1448308 RepID=A0A2T2N820_CORCC|nr:hypothetical protein BS50DRAFT_143423 [Corynespora cassiicola Philippines]